VTTYGRGEQNVDSFSHTSIVGVIYFFVAQNLPADDELKIVAGTTNSILGFLVTQLVDLSFVDTEESISHSQTGLLCQTVTVDLNRLK